MLNDEQIKHMVDRFLNWRLPKTWNPDNGISYKRPNYAHPPADHDWPVGTNLFSADEAAAMVRHMIEGLARLTTRAVPDGYKTADASPARCEICGLPLANNREVGCVHGDSPEWHRIQERRRALSKPDKDGWQPIEMAPKDGTVIIIAGGTLPKKLVTLGWFDLGKWRIVASVIDHEPTVWRPLPAPPAQEDR